MAQYRAYMIVIGDELLSGKIQDANIQKTAKWMTSEGFILEKVVFCKDSEESLLSALQDAWDNADLILTTGGLGPTQDDITKLVVAKFFNSTLVENERAMDLAREQYARINKKWTTKTNSYHLLPEGIEPVANPKGLAPGLAKVAGQKLFLSAPGVPRELVGMLEESFHPFLNQSFPQRENRQQVLTIRTYGVPEEKIFFDLMPDLWAELQLDGKVSSLPQTLGVDIHLGIEGSEDDLKAIKLKWQERLTNSPLKDYIWAWELIPLEELVVREAAKKNLKISLAESCTGGLVGHRLTNVSGSSAVFNTSFITYSNESKQFLLGVKEETLINHGAVSIDTAQEMALGALEKGNADISISLSGIAGPGGGSEEKPVGTVCIGEANKKESFAKIYHFNGSRDHLKTRFSEMALHRLRLQIENY